MSDTTKRVAAARAGSSEALGQALQACRGYLLLLADRELDPDLRAKGGASDLVQETFLEAQKDFAQFQGNSEDELRAWLRQILLHNLANFTRRYRATAKRRLGREVALNVSGSSADREGGLRLDALSPSGMAMEEEQARALRRALERLGDDHRQVILLHYQEQRPFEEIAPLMNRSYEAVRSLWARAIRRLRQEMEAPS
jgi:RNA polymerase sigma-70 factor (ECF subfamily)